MAGHSKWSTIKRSKAKNDAANSKIFTKLLREISVAVKEGGSDVNANNRLKIAVSNAKSKNMPNDTITRTIKKASGELSTINYTAVRYEGYGPNGSAVMVETLTDNKNRTAGEVRHFFDKFGGSLGTTNCVSYLFSTVGQIIVLKNNLMDDDEFMLHALDIGADDVVVEEDYYKVLTQQSEFENIKSKLEELNIEIEDSEITMIASNNLELPDDKLKLFEKLIDALEDNDDVQQVYHNVILPEYEEE